MRVRLRNGIDHALGMFGLLLIRLVARLVRPAYVTQSSRPVRGFLARRVIDLIVMIGRLVDRLSGYPAPSEEDDARVTANRRVVVR